ncbi:hypothetical protein ACFE04_030426 [Oxalis oulophora]
MGGKPYKAGKFAPSLRLSLWSEHLGLHAGERDNPLFTQTNNNNNTTNHDLDSRRGISIAPKSHDTRNSTDGRSLSRFLRRMQPPPPWPVSHSVFRSVSHDTRKLHTKPSLRLSRPCLLRPCLQSSAVAALSLAALAPTDAAARRGRFVSCGSFWDIPTSPQWTKKVTNLFITNSRKRDLLYTET